MAFTKRDFVLAAFEEIGYASYIYDAMPEQLESVLRSLDMMMATWNGKGIRVGYPLPSSPSGSNLDTVTDVSDALAETIYKNLAIRIAPRFGKTIPQETKQAAKEGYDALLIKIAMPIEQNFPTRLPAGAGNKPWRRTQTPFIVPPDEPLDAGNDDVLTFE
jgi:hypothetical protein